MTGPRVLPCGERAFLVEVADLDAVLALDARVRELVAREDLPVEDIVPAARTLLVATPAAADLPGVRDAVVTLADQASDAEHLDATAPADVVEIAVHYDGPDLTEVATLVGLTVDEVVAAHTGTPWRVGFGGFAPGFAYLVNGDPRLEVPRRSSPRTSVPTGAVALAGAYSGIYPRASPGGWQLIGHTDQPLWDADRTPPALLQPGALVRFVDAGPANAPEASEPVTSPTQAEASASPERSLTVLKTGPLTLVQDAGRPGWKHVGVGRAGAADQSAAALANRLVGNEPDAALLEITFGGFAARVDASVIVAATGALAPLTVNGTPAAHGQRLHLVAGDELRLGMPSVGLRTYLAFSGGLDVPATLGSRSTDTMANLGPAKLASGVTLALGPQPALPTVRGDHPTFGVPEGVWELEFVPGPRADWIAAPEALVESTWTVSTQCDRVGVRLEGDPLTRAASFEGAELPSEGVMRGAIQVPPSGLPVVFGNDHPVTGGYPVVGVLTEASSDALAQARPGQAVRFRPTKARP